MKTKAKKIPAIANLPSQEVMLRAVFGPEAATLTPMDVQFLGCVVSELSRARGKFPCSIHSFAALVEEVGELGKAFISETEDRVCDEAMQTAVMAIRCATEGDKSFAVYRNMTGLDKHD